MVDQEDGSMKKVVWTLAMLALTSGMAAAQDVNEMVADRQDSTVADHSALNKALIENEHKLADAMMKKDKPTVTALIAPDAWSADANGFMKAAELFGALDQLVIDRYQISDERVVWIDAVTALVTYKWTGSGTFSGQRLPPTVYASTVWTKKAGKWVAMFHQETEPAKAAAVRSTKQK
jgi:hypothetical protein